MEVERYLQVLRTIKFATVFVSIGVLFYLTDTARYKSAMLEMVYQCNNSPSFLRLVSSLALPCYIKQWVVLFIYTLVLGMLLYLTSFVHPSVPTVLVTVLTASLLSTTYSSLFE